MGGYGLALMKGLGGYMAGKQEAQKQASENAWKQWEAQRQMEADAQRRATFESEQALQPLRMQEAALRVKKGGQDVESYWADDNAIRGANLIGIKVTGPIRATTLKDLVERHDAQQALEQQARLTERGQDVSLAGQNIFFTPPPTQATPNLTAPMALGGQPVPQQTMTQPQMPAGAMPLTMFGKSAYQLPDPTDKLRADAATAKAAADARKLAVGHVLDAAVHDSLDPRVIAKNPGKSRPELIQLLAHSYGVRLGVQVTANDINALLTSTGAMETRAGVAAERLRNAGESDRDFELRIRKQVQDELTGSGKPGKLPAVNRRPYSQGGFWREGQGLKPGDVPVSPTSGLAETSFTPKPTTANQPTFDPYTEKDEQGRTMLSSMGVAGPRMAVSNLLGTGVKVNGPRLKTYLKDMADVRQMPMAWMPGKPITERRKGWKKEISAALNILSGAAPKASKTSKTDELKAIMEQALRGK